MRYRSLSVLAAAGILLAATTSAYAFDVSVDCSSPKAKIRSINAALPTLSKAGPNTISVSGTCNEAVIIDGFDQLTLVANPGAMINDPTPSTTDDNSVVAVTNSRSLTIEGFTINQGSFGISCDKYSVCYLRSNTVQNAADSAVFIGHGSSADLINNVLQASGAGLVAYSGAQASVAGGTIRDNLGSGVDASAHSFVRLLGPGDGVTSLAIENNGEGSEPAVLVNDDSMVVLGRATITSNQGDGVVVKDGSVLRVGQAAQVTGNGTVWPGSTGIRVGDSSSAFVSGNGNVTEVICEGVFSRVRASVTSGLTCQNPP